MDLRLCFSAVSRLFFGASLVLLALAVIEKVANLSGQTVLAGRYEPGRLLEFAGILLVFVISMLLREIRDDFKNSRKST